MKQIGGGLADALGSAIERWTGLGAYKRRSTYGRRGAYTRRRTYGGQGAYRRQARSSYTRRGAYKRRITGRGSYNEIENGMMAPLPPTFRTSKNSNYVEIEHREYIGDVYSSGTAGALSVSSFYINPSDTLTFPWLSQIAAVSFQQYELCGCIFQFKSFSSDALNSTNTALGCVVAAVNYDALDAVPNTRADLENTDWAQAYKPSQSFEIPVECARNETFARGLLYTRQSENIASGQDRRMYDLGRLDIASLGMQGTSVNLGSLYVVYKVKLYKTVMLAPLVLAGLYHIWNNTSIAASTPLGVVANDTTIRNNIGWVHTSATVMTLPINYCVANAVYRMDILWSGTGNASLVNPSITFGGSLSTVNGIGDHSGSMDDATYGNGGSTASALLYTAFFQVSNTPTAAGTITFGTGATLPTGTVSIDFQVTQLSGVYNLNT